MTRARWALGAVVALGAALRLPGLDAQSFWYDEAFTVALMRDDLGGMLSGIAETESTPPLYYVLAWPWAKLLGTGEVGLRALSALFGIATVPLAHLIGRELAGRRAALIAAALVAVNPYLIWYSQEARAYALYALLAALSFLFFLRVLDAPDRRNVALWTVASALALCTHWFAAFPVVAEAAWLLARSDEARRRTLLAGIGALALVGAALAPLALEQRSAGRNEWVEETPLAERVLTVAKRFLTGEFGTPVDALAVLAALVAAVGLWLLAARAAAPERRRAALALGYAAAVVGLPLVLAVAGFDYFFDHYVIAALVPFLCALAVGFAAARAWRGWALAAAFALIGAGVSVNFQLDDELQRDDWRKVADTLGSPSGGRAIVVDRLGSRPLELYLGGADDLPDEGAAVRELDLAESFRFGSEREPEPPRIPGFALVARIEGPAYRLMRYTAPAPVAVNPQTLSPYGLDDERFFLHQP